MESKKVSKKEDLNDVEFVSSATSFSRPDLTYPRMTWLTSTEFIRFEKSKLDEHFPWCQSGDVELSFIGKTRARLSLSNKITDQIGSVKRSTRKLQLCHNGRVFNVDTFTILAFHSSKHFTWSQINLFSMAPKNGAQFSNALKLGYDTVAEAVLYAGRSQTHKNVNFIGKLDTSLNLIIPKGLDEIIQLKKYELLCVKPWPSSLKQLCRLKLRNLMRNENSKINRLEYLIEANLLGYVKYSHRLKFNQQLRPGECLISKNGKFKLSLENDGRLLYFLNERRDCYLFLYENVESLWFADLRLVVCFRNLTSTFFLSNFKAENFVMTDGKLELLDNGCLRCRAPDLNENIVFQFRDDLNVYWNSKTANKFEYVYYLESKDRKKEAEDDSSESEDEDDDEDDDETDEDSDDSDSDSSG